MYENQRRAQIQGKLTGIIFFAVIVIAVNLWLGIRWASAPELSKQKLCNRSELNNQYDLRDVCAVQDTWDKSEAGTWWGGADGVLLFIGLAAFTNIGRKKK